VTGLTQCLSNKAREAVFDPKNRRVNNNTFLARRMVIWRWELIERALTVKLLYNISIIYIYLGYSFVMLSAMIPAG
jgi:hypothetical protein